MLFIRNRIAGTVTTIRARRSEICVPIWPKAFLRNVQTDSGAHPASYLSGYRSYFRAARRPRLKLTIHLQLARRLRMSGATPLLSAGVDMNNSNFYF